MTDMLLIAGWCFAVSLFVPLFVWALMPLLPRCAATRHLVWLALFGTLLVLPLLALVLPPQIVLPQAPDAAAAPVAAVVRHGWSMADTISLLILAWLLGVGFHLARLEAVLAHERAHLSRRDSFTQMLAQLACAFYWPNLLLWLAARSMRHQAEIAADNAALAGGIRASDYAAELLQLAGQNLRLPAPAMAAPSLEARVKSVLSPMPSRNGVRVLDVFKIAWLGSAVALALVRPAIAQAQDAPSAPAAPHVQAAPLPDAPPVPAAPIHHHHHITVSIHGDGLTAAERARIDAAVAQVRATMAEVRPEIDRAMQQAGADRAAAQSVQQAMPQIHAAIAQAQAQIKPVIHRAFVDTRVDVKVSVVLDRAQAQIDQAMAHAERDAAHAAARAQHDAEREAARAARAQAHDRDENPDPGDANP